MGAVDLDAYVARSRAVDLAGFAFVRPVEAWIDAVTGAPAPLAAGPPASLQLQGGRHGDGHL